MVDSNGDGQIDHAVAAIGYRLNGGVQEYACWDTWYSTVRWTPFRGVSSSYASASGADGAQPQRGERRTPAQHEHDAEHESVADDLADRATHAVA